MAKIYVCKVCGKEYTPRFRTSKYCSKECYGLAGRNFTIGDRVGKVTIIGKRRNGNNTYRKYKCDCGTIAYKDGSLLKKEGEKCACKKCRQMIRFEESNKQDKRFCRMFSTIKYRCKSKKKDYGGRGIKCKWETYDDFYNDMYESYKEHVEKYGEKNTTLDRIDVDGNYCKENCRRATYQVQENNKRNTVYVEYDGKKISIFELSKILGIKKCLLYDRIKKGYSIDYLKEYGNKVKTTWSRNTYKGITKSMKERSEILGVSYDTIRSQAYYGKKKGLSFEYAMKKVMKKYGIDEKKILENI